MDWLKQRLPTKEQVHEHKVLKMFGHRLHDRNLWHFNRRSVTRATGIGLFCAFLPMPFEMIPAAFGAVLWRANLPLSISWVWISNPLTWIPLWGPPYLLGVWLLDIPVFPLDQLITDFLANPITSLSGTLGAQLAALWLGCTIVGIVLGVAGYFTVDLLWRLRIINLWRARREQRANDKTRSGT